MATTFLRPVATLFNTAQWSAVGAASLHAATSDSSLATYAEYESASAQGRSLHFDLADYTLSLGPPRELMHSYRFTIQASNKLGADEESVLTLYRVRTDTKGNKLRANVMEVILDETTRTYNSYWDAVVSQSGSDSNPHQTFLDTLRLELEVRGAVSGISGNARIYEVSMEMVTWTNWSTPTVSAPTGTVTNTNVPDVTTSAVVNDGTPSKYTIIYRWYDQATFSAPGFDPDSIEAIHETRLYGESLSYDTSGNTFEQTESFPDFVLPNNGTYRVYTRFVKLNSPFVSWTSPWGFSEFTISLAAPNPPTSLSATPITSSAYFAISVGLAALTYDELARVEVQRSYDNVNWEYIVGSNLVDPAYSSPKLFEDHTSCRGCDVYYRARVREREVSSGDILASEWKYLDAPPVVLNSDNNWWLKNTADSDQNMVVELGGGDDLPFEHQLDVAHFRVIGSTVWVAVADSVRGPKITFTAQTITKEEYANLKALWQSQDTLLLQSPMGDDEQWFGTVDSPVQDSLKNTNDPWHDVTITLISSAEPVEVV